MPISCTATKVQMITRHMSPTQVQIHLQHYLNSPHFLFLVQIAMRPTVHPTKETKAVLIFLHLFLKIFLVVGFCFVTIHIRISFTSIFLILKFFKKEGYGDSNFITRLSLMEKRLSSQTGRRSLFSMF